VSAGAATRPPRSSQPRRAKNPPCRLDGGQPGLQRVPLLLGRAEPARIILPVGKRLPDPPFVVLPCQVKLVDIGVAAPGLNPETVDFRFAHGVLGRQIIS